MYDLPEVAWATDRLWQDLRGRLVGRGFPDVPAALSRDADPEALWTDPDLLLSQSCGWPLMHRHRARLRVLATPIYGFFGCDGPKYRSHVIVRDDHPATSIEDLRASVCAVNGWDSQSGWNALAALIADTIGPDSFFAAAVVTGSHVASLAAVAAGRADVAAIDCVTYGLLARHRPAALAGLRILGAGPPAPGLPFVTRRDLSGDRAAALAAAVIETCAAPEIAAARDALGLVGAVPASEAAYEVIPAMTARAIPPPPSGQTR